MNYRFWAKMGFADNNGDAEDIDDNNQNKIERTSFLGASKRLHKPVCPSESLHVCLSVRHT